MLSDLDNPTKGIRSIMSQAAAVSFSRPVQSFVPTQRPVPQQHSQPVQQLEAPPSYLQIMPPPTASYNVLAPVQNSFQPRSQNNFQGQLQNPS